VANWARTSSTRATTMRPAPLARDGMSVGGPMSAERGRTAERTPSNARKRLVTGTLLLDHGTYLARPSEQPWCHGVSLLISVDYSFVMVQVRGVCTISIHKGLQER